MIRCSFPLNDRDRRQGTPRALRAARSLFTALGEADAQVLTEAQAKEALTLLLQAQHFVAQAARFAPKVPQKDAAL